MKRVFVFFAAVLLIWAPNTLYARGTRASESKSAVSVDPNLPGRVDMYYFYDELCELCESQVQAEFYDILKEKLPYEEREVYPNAIHVENIFKSDGRYLYEQVTDEMGLDRSTLEPPFLLVGGRVYQGHQSISNNIEEAFLTAAEDLFVNKRVYTPAARKTGEHLFDDYAIKADHVTMVYFYRITCPECAKVTPIVNELPDTIKANGKQLPLDIIRINTRGGNNGERVTAFFDAYQVPDEDRMVPIIFFSGSYLAGLEQISAGLQAKLEQGPGTWNGLIPQ
jgi:thiol-disulfide isomerase/thioredoxin